MLNGIKGFDRKAFEDVHASEEQITSIRLNPFKQKLLEQQPTPNYQPSTKVPWCDNAYYLQQRPFFTFDPVFHAGAYYVQEASSMFLWHVLQQIVGVSSQQKVLDVCAAPGGKSTLLATYFNNGLLVSNEVIKSRANILVENITKWGSDNVVVTNNDPAHFKFLAGYFDVMVIDAPCSGSGLFRKDADAVSEWSEDNVNLCSFRQQRIVADVLPSLKENGILIYSTCSYSKQEDEDISDWLMNEFELENCRIPLQENWNIVEVQSDKYKAYGYRFYPYLVKGEGFFIAAFKKKTNEQEFKTKEQKIIFASKQEQQMIDAFMNLPSSYQLIKQNDRIKAVNKQWMSDLQVLAKNLYIKKAGIELGSIKGKDVIPHHELAMSLLPLNDFPKLELSEADALQYLRKKEVVANASIKGWNLITHCGLPLGWVKVLPNRMNNYYPAEWRILKD
jgi:16S rRNA C967 or C1407 C5-methylase (RsmB/RsmF family)/NOL1/NOP2/fmu family ribosome biogenesis protein